MDNPQSTEMKEIKISSRKSTGNKGNYQQLMPITNKNLGKNYFKSGMHSHSRREVEFKIARGDDSWKHPPKK